MADATAGIFTKPIAAYKLRHRSDQEEDGPCVSNADAGSMLGDMCAMTVASGTAVGKFFTTFINGFLVEMPLATAEGFRNIPRIYGDEVQDYGRVTNIRTGFVKAGKSFAQGVGAGFDDLTTKPAAGGRTGGTLGALKGFGIGATNLVSKTVAGSLGLVAYPGQRISRSIHASTHGSTSKNIMTARLEEAAWRAERASEPERRAVVDWHYALQRVL